MEESLAHYGKLGMKWGVHKEQQAAYRQKAARVANNRYAQSSDIKRAKYASQPPAARIAKTAVGITARMVVHDIFTGDIGRYGSMSKTEMAKRATSIAVRTTATVAVKDALAKSAMKNYTDKGKVVRGTNRSSKIVTKEDLIETGVRVGVLATMVGAKVGPMKYTQAAAQRSANEARFNAWGQNILPQKVDNVIWSSDDMAIIDNRRR